MIKSRNLIKDHGTTNSYFSTEDMLNKVFDLANIALLAAYAFIAWGVFHV